MDDKVINADGTACGVAIAAGASCVSAVAGPVLQGLGYRLVRIRISSAGASVLACGLILPAIYLTWSLKNGPKASANPWGATGLEWQTSSPPPTENFAVTPVVTTEAYDYSAIPEVTQVG